MNDQNPLSELLIDEAKIGKRADAILSTVLKPYVEIIKSSKDAQFTEVAHGLPVKEKILIALAARLALKRLDMLADESMSQKDLIDYLKTEGVPEGSVKSSLKKLHDARLVSKEKSRYLITLDKLPKLQKILGDSDE